MMSAFVSFILTIFQAPTAAAAAEAAAVPDGGISPLAWVIISGLASAVVGEALFIKKLYDDISRCHVEKNRFVEDQLSLIKTLRDEFENNGNGDKDKDKPSGGAA